MQCCIRVSFNCISNFNYFGRIRNLLSASGTARLINRTKAADSQVILSGRATCNIISIAKKNIENLTTVNKSLENLTVNTNANMTAKNF
jgi:hypothetical protein